MQWDHIHGNGRIRTYRNLNRGPGHPAPGQPGTLRQQFAALADYLELQSQDRLEGPEAARRWNVVHSVNTGSPIPGGY